VSEEEEELGLDLSQHNESAYAFGLAGYGESVSASMSSAFAAKPAEAIKPKLGTTGSTE
jgi:hypothetical protein